MSGAYLLNKASLLKYIASAIPRIRGQSAEGVLISLVGRDRHVLVLYLSAPMREALAGSNPRLWLTAWRVQTVVFRCNENRAQELIPTDIVCLAVARVQTVVRMFRRAFSEGGGHCTANAPATSQSESLSSMLPHPAAVGSRPYVTY